MDIILQAKTLEKKQPSYPSVWDCPSCGKKVSPQGEGVYYQVIRKGFIDQRIVYTACSVACVEEKIGSIVEILYIQTKHGGRGVYHNKLHPISSRVFYEFCKRINIIKDY
ncbi:hypothetical protein [Priestia megaterium]